MSHAKNEKDFFTRRGFWDFLRFFNFQKSNLEKSQSEWLLHNDEDGSDEENSKS